MRNYCFIAVMGALGAMARYGAGLLFSSLFSLPVGTLIVNAAGCFLLEVIFHVLSENQKLPSWTVNGLGVGFVGALTTFSTFSVENAGFLLDGRYGTAALYTSLSLLCGLAAAWAGFLYSKRWSPSKRSTEQ